MYVNIDKNSALPKGSCPLNQNEKEWFYILWSVHMHPRYWPQKLQFSNDWWGNGGLRANECCLLTVRWIMFNERKRIKETSSKGLIILAESGVLGK